MDVLAVTDWSGSACRVEEGTTAAWVWGKRTKLTLGLGSWGWGLGWGWDLGLDGRKGSWKLNLGRKEKRFGIAIGNGNGRDCLGGSWVTAVWVLVDIVGEAEIPMKSNRSKPRQIQTLSHTHLYIYKPTANVC